MKRYYIGVVLLCMSLLSGCNFTKKQRIEENAKESLPTISILTSKETFQSTTMLKVAKAIEEDYGYKADFQVIPDSQYFTLTKAKIATGEVPDIIEYNTPANNIELGVKENCIPLDKEPWVERLVDKELLQDKSDGKIYAMPIRENRAFYGAAYFNKTLLTELGVEVSQPTTYPEFLERLEAINSKGSGKISPIYASNKVPSTTQIFMTMGFTVVDYPNQKETIEKLLQNQMKFTEVAGYKKVIEDYKALYEKGYVNSNHLQATYDMAIQAVGTGQAAMMFSGEWSAKQIEDLYPNVTMGAWVIPFNDQLILCEGNYTRGWFLMKNGKNKEYAQEYMRIWSLPKYQNMYYKEQPALPPFKDVEGSKLPDAMQYLIDEFVNKDRVAYQINDEMYLLSPIWPKLWQLYIEMFSIGKTPEEVLSEWQGIYEVYMKQKKQLNFY